VLDALLSLAEGAAVALRRTQVALHNDVLKVGSYEEVCDMAEVPMVAFDSARAFFATPWASFCDWFSLR